MPFGFFTAKACPSDGKGDACFNLGKGPCKGPHWTVCNGVRLPELTGVCVSFGL